MTRAPFPQKSKWTSTCITISAFGRESMRTESCGKAKYFVTFIDDCSHWCEVRFIKHKSEIFKEFVKAKSFFENQKDAKIKWLQTDNGTEYLSEKFSDYLDTQGILTPYNLEQNEVAKRRNRTLVEAARCLLIQSGLPQSFWAKAVFWAKPPTTYETDAHPSRWTEGRHMKCGTRRNQTSSIWSVL